MWTVCVSTAYLLTPSCCPLFPVPVSLCEQRERSGKIQLMDLAQHFHLPINDAAKALGICPTGAKEDLPAPRDAARWSAPQGTVLDWHPPRPLLYITGCLVCRPMRALAGAASVLYLGFRRQGLGCTVLCRFWSLERIIATLEEKHAAAPVGGTPWLQRRVSLNEIKALKREKELLCAGNLGSL